jgi:TonB family protein
VSAGAQASVGGALRPHHRGFSVFFAVSLCLHAVGIAVYAWGSSVRRPTIDLSQSSIKASLVRLGQKREEKLLPRKTAAPAVKPDEKALAVDQPAPEDKVEPRRQDKMQDALKKLEDEARRKQAREDALKRIAETVGGDEDVGDPNGSVHGTETQAQEMTLTQAYFARLHDQIKAFYSVPAIISEAERRKLEAVIVISVGADGSVLDHDFERRSGNDAFDSALEAAIQRASPLPAPPAFLRDTLKKGVGLRFRP